MSDSNHSASEPNTAFAELSSEYAADVASVQRISAVPRILEVICRTTGMGFAAVARVTDDHWVCCAVRDEIEFGLRPGGELDHRTTICNEIQQSHEAVVIDNVAADPTYCGHHTPAKYGFQSYISTPIIREDGSFFGTLCAIDPRPARLATPETVGMFKLFAELIASHLDANDRLTISQASLVNEQANSELREQFIAVLGHDLRNPLASIAAGIKMLPRAKTAEASSDILGFMNKSVGRMSDLIDNVLDFARGRLGSGISLSNATQDVQPILDQVIDELRSSHPAHVIDVDLAVTQPVNCDSGRIGQLLSNLLGNALTHGAEDFPISVRAVTQGGVFKLSVSNAGEPISAAAMDQLFQPFYRGIVRQSLQGLGLGLFIASEIARAHGGTLTVNSTAAQTHFTFRMPLQPVAGAVDAISSRANTGSAP